MDAGADGIAELGRFWLPDGDKRAGTLTVDQRGPSVKLVGCLPSDEIRGEMTADDPRWLPADGREHPVLLALLRNRRAATIVGVQGSATQPLLIANGVQWGDIDFSGDASYYGRFAVLDLLEDSEPAFKEIHFEITGLQDFLGRNVSWRPSTPVDALHGVVPVVVPQIPDHEFELRPGLNMRFVHSTSIGPDTRLGSVSRTKFAFRACSGGLLFSEVRSDLWSLVRFAEFVSGRHQAAINVVGIRESSHRRRRGSTTRGTNLDRYPIRLARTASIRPQAGP